MDKSKNLIAVWGTPGAGKTTMAAKLAAAFAEEQREVLLIMNDLLSPSMSLLLPMEKRSNRSLRNLFARRENRACITEDDIINNLVPVDKHKHILLLAYETGDNFRIFAGYDIAEAHDLLTTAVQMASVVIVDCASDLCHDPLSLAALERAGTVLRVMQTDVKSLVAMKSTLPLLFDEEKYHARSHKTILNNLYDWQDKRVFHEQFGVCAEISHSPMLHCQAANGALLEPLNDRRVAKELKQLHRMLIDEVGA